MRRAPGLVLWRTLTVAATVVLSSACGGHSNGTDGTEATGTRSSGGGAVRPTGSTASADPVARGEQLAGAHNCLSCHSTTGAQLAGPTWKGLAGSRVKLANGETVTADHGYLVRSILDPDAQVVDGFSRGIMSAFIRPGSVTPEEAEAIARYVESLRWPRPGRSASGSPAPGSSWSMAAAASG